MNNEYPDQMHPCIMRVCIVNTYLVVGVFAISEGVDVSVERGEAPSERVFFESGAGD